MRSIHAAVALCLCLAPAWSQHHGHHGGNNVMFVVQADGAQVVPRSDSTGTATGAFLVDARKRAMSYQLTFAGLRHAPVERIALHNFGAGVNGPTIYEICGPARNACPSGAAGHLSGQVDSASGLDLDENLLGELASARVYLEITGANARKELRGQLEPNGAMLPVKNYVANLAPLAGARKKGAGTAVLSETHYADGRVDVFYRVTVAGTTGAPTSAAVGAPVGATAEVATLHRALPATKRIVPAPAKGAVESASGGTLTGQYQASRKAPGAVTLNAMGADKGSEIAITVRTTTHPQGELQGIFKAVR